MVAELMELMRSAPSPMRPQRFYLTRKIPWLPSSKLDLGALMALDKVNVQNERANVAAAAAEGPAECDCIARAAARVWQEVLETPVNRPEDDFFDSGGDSLKVNHVYDYRPGFYPGELTHCRDRRHSLDDVLRHQPSPQPNA